MDASDPSRRLRPALIGAALVALAALIAYANSFDGVFVFDDRFNIENNEAIRSLWPLGPLLDNRRPLVTISFAINYALGGLDPFGYHLVNLLIHLAASVSLMLLIREALLQGRFRETTRRSANAIATAIALLWTLHPLQTQSVTYIVQRGESLMGLFYILTLLLLARSAVSERRWPWWIGATLACALGMATKGVMVTAPVIALLFDRAFIAGSFARAIRARWPLHLMLALTWLVLGWVGLFRGILGPLLGLETSDGRTVGFAIESVSWIEYARSQPGVILHYLRLSVAPIGQCLDPGWPVARSAWAIVAPLIPIAALALASFALFVRNHWLGFLGAFLFGALAPTSSVIPIRDLAYEHRMYLPLAAVLAALVGLGVFITRRLGDRLGADRARQGALLALGLACLTLLTLTWRRNQTYHSPLSVWREVAEHCPENARGVDQYGIALAEAGRLDEAIAQFESAREADPDYFSARFNLGVGLIDRAKRDRDPEAFRTGVAELRAAGEIEPDNVVVQLKLGEVFFDAGDMARAEKAYEAAAAMDLESRDQTVQTRALRGLGRSRAARSDLAGAEAALRRLLALQPDNSRAWQGLGALLERQDDLAGARSAYERALEIDSGYDASRRGLERVRRRLELRSGAP